MSENMYSWFSTTCTVWLYQYNNILSSISLPELLCTYNVATDKGVCNNVAICPGKIGCHTNVLLYRHWKMPPILPLPSVKYIIVHWSFFQQFNKTNKNCISFLSVIVSVERPVIMISNTYFRMTELPRVRSPTHSIRILGQGVELTLAN